MACPEAVRAQELDLMSELVVERLNQALGRPAVRRLRVQARKAPRGPDAGDWRRQLRGSTERIFSAILQHFCNTRTGGFRGTRLLES